MSLDGSGMFLYYAIFVEMCSKFYPLLVEPTVFIIIVL